MYAVYFELESVAPCGESQDSLARQLAHIKAAVVLPVAREGLGEAWVLVERAGRRQPLSTRSLDKATSQEVAGIVGRLQLEESQRPAVELCSVLICKRAQGQVPGILAYSHNDHLVAIQRHAQPDALVRLRTR